MAESEAAKAASNPEDDIVMSSTPIGYNHFWKLWNDSNPEDDIVFRLETRADIRRQISSRKSVQEGKPDRISDLLEEAARIITILRKQIENQSE